MQFQLSLDNILCPSHHPHPTTNKAPKENKLAKQSFFSFSHRIFTKLHNIRIKKLILILPLRESNSDHQYRGPQIGSQKFMLQLILIKNFIKSKKLKIGYT